MMINKNAAGYIVISDIINGQLIEKKYLYYTKKEAVAKFNKLNK